MCPDCGAWCERWGQSWRCPWSRATAQQMREWSGENFIFNCGKPYKEAKGRTEIASPIHGRRTD